MSIVHVILGGGAVLFSKFIEPRLEPWAREMNGGDAPTDGQLRQMAIGVGLLAALALSRLFALRTAPLSMILGAVLTMLSQSERPASDIPETEEPVT